MECVGKHAKVEYEDLVQVGFFAMMDAVEKYDPARGGNFIGSLGYALQKRFAEEGGHRSSKRDALLLAGSTDESITADDPDRDTIGGSYSRSRMGILFLFGGIP